MIGFLIKLIVVLIFVFFFVSIGRTWVVERAKEQDLFLNGKATIPNGLYMGTVDGLPTYSWLGKKFDMSTKTGINVFTDNEGTQREQYAFKTSVRKGIRDRELDVIAIDYNVPGNPFWLRSVLDEVVEVAPGHYLGKLHFTLLGHAYTYLYFELTQN